MIMNRKEGIGNKQTFAELRNVQKKIKHLEMTAGAVPITLFERRTALEQRVHQQNTRLISR